MRERVNVSAPGKLMLFGEHAVIYDRPCIVAAVDQRVAVSIETRNDKLLCLKAPDVGIQDYRIELDRINESENLPKGVRFVEAAVRTFSKEKTVSFGLDIETRSGFSSEFGFGSSSAVTVGVIKALSEVLNHPLTERELFDLSYQTVLDVQGVGSGFDLAAATWGGVVQFVTGGKEINSLDVSEVPLVVGYTGIKADTPTLVRQVGELYKSNEKVVGGIFDSMALVTREAQEALERRDFGRVGELMNINQGLLDVLGVSTRELSNLIFAAREGGAMGAKLSGAGGGDCMIAFVAKSCRKKVEDLIRSAGGIVIDTKIPAEGVRIEK